MLSGERSWSQPRLVGPREFFGVPDNRRLLGGDLKKETERIRVEPDVTMGVANFKFIMRALAHARDEDLPDPGGSQQSQRVTTPVPVIEIADDADALRIGRPDRKAGARHPVNHAQLGAELLVNPPFVPLVEKIQVGFAQRG